MGKCSGSISCCAGDGLGCVSDDRKIRQAHSRAADAELNQLVSSHLTNQFFCCCASLDHIRKTASFLRFWTQRKSLRIFMLDTKQLACINGDHRAIGNKVIIPFIRKFFGMLPSQKISALLQNAVFFQFQHGNRRGISGVAAYPKNIASLLQHPGTSAFIVRCHPIQADGNQHFLYFTGLQQTGFLVGGQRLIGFGQIRLGTRGIDLHHFLTGVFSGIGDLHPQIYTPAVLLCTENLNLKIRI